MFRIAAKYKYYVAAAAVVMAGSVIVIWAICRQSVVGPNGDAPNTLASDDPMVRDTLNMLASDDPMVLERTLYGLKFKSIPDGPDREKIKARVRELLGSDQQRVLGAAISVSNHPLTGGLDIVNDPGGLDLVREAIRRYIATQSPFPGGVHNGYHIKQFEDGKFWLQPWVSMP